MRQAMKFKYLYTLLTLIIALCFVPASAQTKHKAKKPAAKVIQKKVTKSSPKKPVKKGGQANENSSLSEEIVVTTAYKPVLADAVKIRRNPDLEDKTPFKAPLTYTTLDKRLNQDSEIRQLDAIKMPAELDSIPKNNYI